MYKRQIPWCDSVPEEYRNSVSSPTFRAQDMTREVVAARSLSYQLSLIHI